MKFLKRIRRHRRKTAARWMTPMSWTAFPEKSFPRILGAWKPGIQGMVRRAEKEGARR
jgi:hypothetical protein